MFCTRCGLNLQNQAACPRCASGNAQQPVVTVNSSTSSGDAWENIKAWIAQNPAPTLYLGLPLLLLILFALTGNRGQHVQLADPNNPTSFAAATVRQGPTFEEADSRMDSRRDGLTEAQKEAYWQSVQGTQVTWAGEVKEVESSGRIRLKCNPRTWTSDTTVQLDGTQSGALTGISKGQRLTITGLLDSHSLGGYIISQGRIVR